MQKIAQSGHTASERRWVSSSADFSMLASIILVALTFKNNARTRPFMDLRISVIKHFCHRWWRLTPLLVLLEQNFATVANSERLRRQFYEGLLNIWTKFNSISFDNSWGPWSASLVRSFSERLTNIRKDNPTNAIMGSNKSLHTWMTVRWRPLEGKKEGPWSLATP